VCLRIALPLFNKQLADLSPELISTVLSNPYVVHNKIKRRFANELPTFLKFLIWQTRMTLFITRFPLAKHPFHALTISAVSFRRHAASKTAAKNSGLEE
jgi:hypothetical protein